MNDFIAIERTLAKLKKMGVKDAAATLNSEESTQVSVRAGKVETLQQSSATTLQVRLFVDNRYAMHATNDLRASALDDFLRRAVDLTRALQEDPLRKLPDPKLYKDRPGPELPLADAAIATRTMAERKAAAFAMEAAARAAGKNVISASAGMSDDLVDVLMMTSNGFRDRQTSTAFSAGVDVTVADGDKRPEDWASATTRQAGALPDVDVLGREAAERAGARVGAKKIASGAYTVIVEARAARTLFGHLLAAMNGQALQQKRSFLDGMVGQQLFSDKLTLLDDPLIPHGLGSRRFDGEGLSAKKLNVVDKGVFKNFFLDTYYARKLGMEPTTARFSNLVVSPGSKSLAELERDAGNAIVVSSFIGGNSNSLTGDFSLGLVGHLLEKGQRKHPVAELNLSGNHKTLWKSLIALGNDPWRASPLLTPTLVFDNAAISGA